MSTIGKLLSKATSTKVKISEKDAERKLRTKHANQRFVIGKVTRMLLEAEFPMEEIQAAMAALTEVQCMDKVKP